MASILLPLSGGFAVNTANGVISKTVGASADPSFYEASATVNGFGGFDVVLSHHTGGADYVVRRSIAADPQDAMHVMDGLLAEV